MTQYMWDDINLDWLISENMPDGECPDCGVEMNSETVEVSTGVALLYECRKCGCAVKEVDWPCVVDNTRY